MIKRRRSEEWTRTVINPRRLHPRMLSRSNCEIEIQAFTEVLSLLKQPVAPFCSSRLRRTGMDQVCALLPGGRSHCSGDRATQTCGCFELYFWNYHVLVD